MIHQAAVLWITKGDKILRIAAGLNTGSVLIRNTEWSRRLIADMATYGKVTLDTQLSLGGL